MRQTPERRQQVLDTANQLIAHAGLARFSMLELARELAMSKETLYAWFGSKDALMAELIGSNAGQAMAPLEKALAQRVNTPAALRAALRKFCRELLALLMSERSVALNRGAVHLAQSSAHVTPADARPEGFGHAMREGFGHSLREGFGHALRTKGRDVVLAQLAQVLQAATQAKLLRLDPPETMAEVLIALCLRDWQLERLLGRMQLPDDAVIDRRAREAVALFWRLYGA